LEGKRKIGRALRGKSAHEAFSKKSGKKRGGGVAMMTEEGKCLEGTRTAYHMEKPTGKGRSPRWAKITCAQGGSTTKTLREAESKGKGGKGNG